VAGEIRADLAYNVKCPKCGYVRLATDVAANWQCPSCQVAYVKAKASPGPPVAAAPESATAPAGTDEADERAVLAASGQKIVIYSILLTFVVRTMAQGNVVAPLIAMGMSFGVAAYSLFGVLRICSALGKSQNQKLMFMALSCMPWVNMIALVVLNAKATALLRAAGWRVGLLGAQP
jgi:hypothetical protein